VSDSGDLTLAITILTRLLGDRKDSRKTRVLNPKGFPPEKVEKKPIGESMKQNLFYSQFF